MKGLVTEDTTEMDKVRRFWAESRKSRDLEEKLWQAEFCAWIRENRRDRVTETERIFYKCASACGGQKRESESLKRGYRCLGTTGHGSGSQTQVLWKSAKHISAQPSLQS